MARINEKPPREMALLDDNFPFDATEFGRVSLDGLFGQTLNRMVAGQCE
jgi:hypothetical protein